MNDEQLDVLSLIVLNTQELLASGATPFYSADDIPDIDLDGHLVDSDVNSPDIDPPAKSAPDTSTSLGPEPPE